MKIVILHGWGQNKTYWNEISSKFNVAEIIALDLPGFGAEPLISEDWGIYEYASWVESKISELKLDNVILLGHSFGGRISGVIATKNPSWLKALILFASPNIYRPSLITKFKIIRYKIFKKIGLIKLSKFFKNKNDELINADRNKLGKIFRKAVVFDQTQELSNIKIPTLIIWGRNDDTTPLRIGTEIHTKIPNSKLAVLDNVGHNIHLENPNLLYGTIKTFIQNL